MRTMHFARIVCRLATLSVLGILTPAMVRAQACTPPFNGALRPIENEATDVPVNVTHVFIVMNGQPQTNSPLSSAADNKWAPNSADISALRTAITVGATHIAYGTSATSVLCQRPFSNPAFATGNNPPQTPPSAALPAVERAWNSASDCQAAGAAWQREISRAPGVRGFTQIVFLEAESGEANVCYYNREYGVTGDPIYVGIFTANQVNWTGVRFEPCALEPAAPRVLQSADKFPSELQAAQWKLQTFLSRRCYNTAVDVSVVGVKAEEGSEGKAVALRYPLQQHDRYRGTVQLGVLFTPQHDNDFGLRRGQPDTAKQFIYNKGPVDDGPEYVATLVIYSILKYLPSLLTQKLAGDIAEPFQGRDVIHDQSAIDRLHAILGVGIANPTKRFVIGLSYEAIYGVNVVGALDFGRIRKLDGVTMSDPFIGSEQEIPLSTHWEKKYSLGLSIDLRYAAELFSGRR